MPFFEIVSVCSSPLNCVAYCLYFSLDFLPNFLNEKTLAYGIAKSRRQQCETEKVSSFPFNGNSLHQQLIMPIMMLV